jgi:hypothetical protein
MEETRTLTIEHQLPLSLWISAISGSSSAVAVLSRQLPSEHRISMNAVSGRPAFAGST